MKFLVLGGQLLRQLLPWMFSSVLPPPKMSSLLKVGRKGISIHPNEATTISSWKGSPPFYFAAPGGSRTVPSMVFSTPSLSLALPLSLSLAFHLSHHTFPKGLPHYLLCCPHLTDLSQPSPSVKPLLTAPVHTGLLLGTGFRPHPHPQIHMLNPWPPMWLYLQIGALRR